MTSLFIEFLRKKTQIREIKLLLIVYIIIYVFLAYCYPHPIITPDTHDYILSAKTMVIDDIRPIGYSWFLRLFYKISNNISFIFFSQYALNIIANIFLILTIKYFFRPKNKIFSCIFSFFIILTPSTLYLTKFILSDSIFNTLTILWLTSCIWIIMDNMQKNIVMVPFHLIIMFLAMKVRYTGLFYPLLSSLLFIKNKRLSIFVILPIIIGGFVYFNTRSTMEKTYSVNTFSGFTGWAQANNAVAIIPYINLKPEAIDDLQNRFIHKIVKQYPHEAFGIEKIMRTLFIWDSKYPGIQIFSELLDQNSNFSFRQRRILTGLILEKYANFLIHKYPLKYLRYFIFPNLIQVFIPDIILGEDIEVKTNSLIKQWYKENASEFYPRWNLYEIYIKPLIKDVNLLLWLMVLSSFVFGIICKERVSFSKKQKLIFWYLISFVIFYIGFSIFAHPVRHRYLIPIYIIQISIIYFIFNNIKSKK